jgi:general secretion pathway protein B
MSLIYDALRKSEQQRRAGETPTLATDPGWGVRRAPPRRRYAPWLWVLVPAVLLAGAAGAWMLYAQRAESPDAPAVVAADASMPAAAQADGLAAAPPSAPAEPAPVPAPPAAVPAEIATGLAQGETYANQPQALVQPPPPAAVDAGQAAAIEALTGAAPTAAPAPPPADAAPAVPAASLLATDASMAAPPAPVEATIPPPTVEAAIPPPPPTPVEPAPMPAQPVAAAPPEPAAAAVAAEPTLPLVYELPYAVRKDMPKLTLSMHVYNDDPARRFAIINDERRAEGADIGGVRLIAIRRDGIELEYAGQRFLLPRAGS